MSMIEGTSRTHPRIGPIPDATLPFSQSKSPAAEPPQRSTTGLFALKTNPYLSKTIFFVSVTPPALNRQK
jgi:hypothetical protein